MENSVCAELSLCEECFVNRDLKVCRRVTNSSWKKTGEKCVEIWFGGCMSLEAGCPNSDSQRRRIQPSSALQTSEGH
eukprot:gene3947-biopygen1510